jgi:DNA-directed RNA polymerase specialized sigma24 family protein
LRISVGLSTAEIAEALGMTEGAVREHPLGRDLAHLARHERVTTTGTAALLDQPVGTVRVLLEVLGVAAGIADSVFGEEDAVCVLGPVPAVRWNTR